MDDKPIATALRGAPPLCDTCYWRNFDSRIKVMCLVDPLKVPAWSCRDYSRDPGVEE